MKIAARIAAWNASAAQVTSLTGRGTAEVATSLDHSISASTIEIINATMIVDAPRSFAVSACRRRRS